MVRAHAQVEGSVSSWGAYGKQPIDVSLSLSQIKKTYFKKKKNHRFNYMKIFNCYIKK